MPVVSVVVPLFNEQPNLDELHARLAAVADSTRAHEWEFLFVDDASTDSSFETLEKLAAGDHRVKAIRLSRNFGSHTAILAGLTHARGEATVAISADLQDPPEIVPHLLRRWREGCEVVWGVRESRDDSRARVILASMYYALARRLALKQTPARGADVVLMSRRVRELVVSMGQHQYIFGAILWLGFRQGSVPYHRAKRQRGQSKWSLSRRITMAIDSFVSFSYFPVRVISCAGIAVSMLGFLYAAFVVVNTILLGAAVPGYASLMVAIVVLSGIQLLMLGIVAEYLWRALQHVQMRPVFVVERTIGIPLQDSGEARR